MPTSVSQAVILAGGMGTRLKPFTDNTPKAMYPFEGKPFLQYIIERIKSFGITNIVILLGYLPEKIIEYFGDGHLWDVHIKYCITSVEDDTGTRLKKAQHLLNDKFLLMYCDNYCPLQWDKMIAQFNRYKPLLQITAYENKDNYTKNNVFINEENQVKKYDKTRTAQDLNGVDIGYILMEKSLIALLPDKNVNFEKELYANLAQQGHMRAYVTAHRYYSVGSWERIELTKQFFNPKKAVFLDRDGTLNIRAPKAKYITCPEEFIWLDEAKQAVSLLIKNGFSVYLVTNQPGIARGMLTKEQLQKIHVKMQEDLSQQGGRVDHIYICPHGWDEGCNCRKPKPGMLYQAQKEYFLDLTQCILIGDDERDIAAGEAAGCKSYLIDEQHNLMSRVHEILNMED